MKGKVIDLSCGKCGSNRLRFPAADLDLVTCEDCGASGKSLGDVKAMMGSSNEAKPTKLDAQRDRHFTEVEESQAGIRESIVETERLVDEAEEMVRRHRKEAEDQAKE